MYRGADKSLARPGRKQVRKHVRDARYFNKIQTRPVIKFLFLQGKAPKEIKPFWQKHLRVSFLVGLRTYQHPCIMCVESKAAIWVELWALLSTQYAVCSTQYAVCSTQYAVCSMQYTVCSMPYAICSMQYAVCRMQYAVCNVDKETN